MSMSDTTVRQTAHKRKYTCVIDNRVIGFRVLNTLPPLSPPLSPKELVNWSRNNTFQSQHICRMHTKTYSRTGSPKFTHDNMDSISFYSWALRPPVGECSAIIVRPLCIRADRIHRRVCLPWIIRLRQHIRVSIYIYSM